MILYENEVVVAGAYSQNPHQTEEKGQRAEVRVASKTWAKEKVKFIKRNKRLARQKQSASSRAISKVGSSGPKEMKSYGVM